MIREWMLYVGVVSACAACAAAAADAWLRARRVQTRWTWGAVFAASVLVPVAVGIRPRPVEPEAYNQAATPAETASPAWEPRVLPLDRWLMVAWAGSSLLVAGALVIGLLQLDRARRHAERATWSGRVVGITPDFGPGAAPFGQPGILVPRWVEQLPPEAIRLLVAHEEEHVRAGDARLLLGATLVVAAMPWNVALWWSLARLRTAIELDCDARVLRREPGIETYARLLLDVACRVRAPATPALLAFADSTSQLATRIDAMTVNRSLGPRGRIVSIILATVALVVACETRRPAPVAPVTDFVIQDGIASPVRAPGNATDSATGLGELRWKGAVPPSSGAPEAPVVIVRAADGTQAFSGRLDRAGLDPLRLPPDQIASVEVIKRREVLPPEARGGLIVITLEAGATWRPDASGFKRREP